MRRNVLSIGLISGLLLAGATRIAQAQLGSGWQQYSPTKKIHLDDTKGLQTFSWTSSKSVCSPTCADYRYDRATDTETFRILDNRSNRSEIRLQNEYSTGRRQFQGYVRFGAPLNDESLFQIFGSTSGATQLMIRGYAASNGSMRGGGKTLATGVYGVERRVNVIHNQGKSIQIYINGSLKNEFVDDEPVKNYHKYGCYGTLKTGAVTVRWRAARSFRDGTSPRAYDDGGEVDLGEPEDLGGEEALGEPEDLGEEEALGEPEDLGEEEPAAAEEGALDEASPAAGCGIAQGAAARWPAGGAAAALVMGLALVGRRRRAALNGIRPRARAR